MIVVKHARILGDGFQCPASSTERSTICAMRMSCTHDIWPCSVDLGVDGKGGKVEESISSSINHFPIVTDKNKIFWSDEREVQT